MVWIPAACFFAGLLVAVALRPHESSEAPHYIPFATEPGIKTNPAWSPKGDRIAYSAEVNGLFQIFTRRLGSSTPTQITRQKVSCFYPFWARDGTRIYYIANGGGLDQSLWSTSVAGGQAEKVLDGVLLATLSPDSKTLALLGRQSGTGYRLMLSSPPGAQPKPYSRQPISALVHTFINGFLQFTADGKYLGLYTNAGSGVEFWRSL
jgi:Tol biopolymer transport system component